MKKTVLILTAILLCLSFIGPSSKSAAAEGTGMAYVEAALPVKASKLYGIGSVSKVFTSAAVMKLVDENRLSLDEPLTTYIPEFEMADSRFTDITPRMLLNHSSGFMGMTDNNAWLIGDNDTWNHDHFLELLKTQKLKHNPGEASIYSNDSFTLAEILIERVSGISFTDFIEQNFSQKLDLENIKTPQSDFNRENLAAIYSGSNELKPENLGLIGSGGIYASMEDLCKFSGIFMDSADGSILSRESVNEMAENQHKKPVVDINADTTFNYGLGWDGVNTYPFNQYGIKALSKGGGTGRYHTNLTVLPEYNLAAAVSSSGTDSNEQLIAQEIIMEILREEGLIGDDELAIPELNLSRMQIPENMKAYAGFYATSLGMIQVEFNNDTLFITPIGVRNERPQEYIYNTDGKFVSINGDYMSIGGLSSAQDGTRGVTTLEFADNKYIIAQIYESKPGLSQTAYAMPIAEKVELNTVSNAVMQAWTDRNSKEYLLVSEKYSSAKYMSASLAKIYTDNRIPGYAGMGIYQGVGKLIKNAKIVNENIAVGYQSTPTMAGRDTNNIMVQDEDEIESLLINDYLYVDAASISNASEVEDSVEITSGAVWFNVDAKMSGHRWRINAPKNGSWFTFDDKMNCVATSLDKYPLDVVVLPENGRIAFVGEAGIRFEIITSAE